MNRIIEANSPHILGMSGLEPELKDLIEQSASQVGCPLVWPQDASQAQYGMSASQAAIILLDLDHPAAETNLELLGEHAREHHYILALGQQKPFGAFESLSSRGILNWLQKPFRSADIEGAMRQGLKYHQLHRQLTQSDRRSRLLEELPDLFFECDEGFRITYVSASLTSLSGYTEEAVLGSSLSRLIEPDDWQQIEAAALERSAPQAPATAINLSEVRLKQQNGEIRWVCFRANPCVDYRDGFSGYLGMIRDQSQLREKRSSIQQVVDKMAIKVNSDFEIISAGFDLEPYLCAKLEQGQPVSYPRLNEFIEDPDQTMLLDFALKQQQDPPFPLKLALGRPGEPKTRFLVHFRFDAAEGVLNGELTPDNLDDQVVVLSKHAQAQKRILEMSVTVDPETQKSILADGINLSEELAKLMTKLQTFAFEGEAYIPEEYAAFFKGKQVAKYQERLRFVSNKIHGLKGSLGFIFPAAKELCHAIEEITKPLGALELVLTGELWRFLSRFVDALQDWIDALNEARVPQVDLTAWLEEIEEKALSAKAWIGEQAAEFRRFVESRSTDDGGLRQREEEAYLSVHKQSYFELRRGFEALFYNLRPHIPTESRIRAGHQLNELLQLHKSAHQVPIKVSRYLRMIPSVAREYGKEVELVVDTGNVMASGEFWTAAHEVLNHVLKNAVVHGLETPEERRSQGKPEKGRIGLTIGEDILTRWIRIEDDGRGVDLDRVRAKALEAGVVGLAEVEQMDERQVLDLLFLQGISTAQTLDQNAGRGVGLNAVKEVLARFNGTHVVSTKLGQGTSWELNFTKSEVTLHCLVVQIGSLRLALPEAKILQLVSPKQVQVLEHLPGQQTAIWGGRRLPLVYPERLFGGGVKAQNPLGHQSFLAIKSEANGRFLLPIDEVVHQAALPIRTDLDDFAKGQLFLGSTLFEDRPLMVLDVESSNMTDQPGA
ncbi:MAG: PAS domain S-box protein [bacterium]|nr:PAS domain S-box protein [bacterium]